MCTEEIGLPGIIMHAADRGGCQVIIIMSTLESRNNHEG